MINTNLKGSNTSSFAESPTVATTSSNMYNSSREMAGFSLQKLVLGEVNCLILAMRNIHSMRYSNRYRFQYENLPRQGGNESPVLVGMRALREKICSNIGWQSMTSLDILQPFFSIIKSEDTEGRITSMALRSIQKLLESPSFISPLSNLEEAKSAIQEIVSAVQQCQFEFNSTDSTSLSESGGPIILDHSLGSGLGSIASVVSETTLLESVLIQIINTFMCCIKCEAGFLIPEDMILEILKSVLRIGRETRPCTDSLRKTAEMTMQEIVKIVFTRYKSMVTSSSQALYGGEKIFEFICEMSDISSSSNASTESPSTASIKLTSPSTGPNSSGVNSIGTRYLGISLACHVIEIIGDSISKDKNNKILNMICNQLCRALLRNTNISYQTILFMANGEMMFSPNVQSGMGSSSPITSAVLIAANGGNLQPTHANYGNNLMLLSAVLKCTITYLASLPNLRYYLHEQIAAVLLALLQHLPSPQQQYGSNKKNFSNSPMLGSNSNIFLPFELQELILEYLVEVCRDSTFITFLYRNYDCYGCFVKNKDTFIVNVNTIPNLFEHIYLYLNSYIGLNSNSNTSNSSQNNFHNSTSIGNASSIPFNNFSNPSSSGSGNLHTLHVLAWVGLLSVVRCLAERCQEQQESRQTLDMNVVHTTMSELKLFKKQKHKHMEIVALFNSSPQEAITQLLQIHNIAIPKDLTLFIKNDNSSEQESTTVDWNEAIVLLQRAAEIISKFLLDYNMWLDKQKIVDYFNSFSSPPSTVIDIKVNMGSMVIPEDQLNHNTYLIPILSKTRKDHLRNALPLEVMRQFMDGFDFYGMRMEECMRYFINRCKISGEGQQVERIIKLLGESFYRDNNTQFALERNESCKNRTIPAIPYIDNGEQAWILAVALMLLHTDLHHQNNRNRMNLADFMKTIGYHDELKGIPQEELHKVYHYLLANEFEVMTGMTDSYKTETIWKEVIVEKSFAYYDEHLTNKPEISESIISYVYDMDMFQSMFGHVILATTTILEHTDDIQLLELAIRGFLDSARVAASYHLHHVFDNLVITLCKFTTLMDGVTPPSISAVSCPTTSENTTSPPTWPVNTSTTTSIMTHDGVVLSTVNSSDPNNSTSSPSSTQGSISSNNKGDTSRTDKNRSILMFGHNEKAKLACRTVFAITRKYGDNLREGWKNILDLICRMRELELLPESIVESRLVRQLREFQFPSSSADSAKLSSPRKDSNDSSISTVATNQLLTSGSSLYNQVISSLSKSGSKKSKPKSQNGNNAPMKSATFSLLSTMFGGFYSSDDSSSEKKKNLDDESDDEEEYEPGNVSSQNSEDAHFSIEIKHALDESRKCIEQCRIVELLMMDAKELSGNSLEYLLSALIRNGKPSGILMTMHIPAPHLFTLKTTKQQQTTTTSTYYYYERDLDTSLFCLDLLCDVLINNNLNRNTGCERLKLIWNYVYSHVYKLMISILQLYQPINTIQSIYQVNNGPNSAPPSVGSSNSFGSSSGSDRNSPLPTTNNNQPLRTRMTKQHYHVLQRCLTCIWRLCMDLSTPSTQFNSIENQAEWEIIQKEMLSVLIDNLGKQWSETMLGVFHNSLLPMIHMFLSRQGDTLLSPMATKFIQDRTNATNLNPSTIFTDSSSRLIVDLWDHLVFKILRSISNVSSSWINNNPNSSLFTSIKPSQQLQLITRSLDVLTLSLQYSTLQDDTTHFGLWFVVPDNIPTFVQSILSVLSSSITTNVNIQNTSSNGNNSSQQFVSTLKKLMALTMDILIILENLVMEILKRIVSIAYSSANTSQNVVKLDNKWINAWLSILEGIAVLCCTGGINTSGPVNVLNLLMNQLNNSQIQMLSQLQRDIRTQALSTLQRSLVYSCDFRYSFSANQEDSQNLKYLLNDQLLMMCMDRVLLKTFFQTLLTLKPKTTEYQTNHNTEMDISSLEELRVRANNLLARIFLHFLPRMFPVNNTENQQDNGFSSLWLTILQVMYNFLLVKPKSDHLREALPELLKNMILVMNNIEVFRLSPKLWELTEKELSQSMPTLLEDVKPRIINTMTQPASSSTATITQDATNSASVDSSTATSVVSQNSDSATVGGSSSESSNSQQDLPTPSSESSNSQQ